MGRLFQSVGAASIKKQSASVFFDLKRGQDRRTAEVVRGRKEPIDEEFFKNVINITA